jgi:hypothetical protein
MIAWLDCSEDVSRYLRGSIAQDSPAELKSELFLDVLLPLVVCGFLAAILIVGVMHVRQGRLAIGNKAIRGPIQGWRLRRRIRAVVKDLRVRAKAEVVEDTVS